MTFHPSISTNILAWGQHEDDSTLWWEPAESTAAAIGDPTGRWKDQSGGGYHQDQATSGNKPTRTADGIDFDGTTDYLSNTSIGNQTGAFTIYLVGRFDSFVNGDEIFSFAATSSSNPHVTLRADNPSRYELLVRDISGGENLAQGGTFDTDFHVFVIKGDGANATAYIDGTQIATVGYPAGSLTAIDTLGLGAFARATPAAFGDVTLKAYYLYTATHNDTDRNTIEGDLDGTYINPSSPQPLAPDTVVFSDTVNNPTIANGTAQPLAPDTVPFTDTVNNVTIANGTAQPLAPDTVVFSDTVNNVTVSNSTAQPLAPDTVSFTDTINNPTIANSTAQTLTPDTVVFTDTVNDVTIANEGGTAQPLAPDTVVFSDTVNNVTVANESAQSLAPDTVVFSDTVNNVTIGNGSVQSLAPDSVTFTDTINNVTIANAGAVDFTVYTATSTIEYPTATNTIEYPTATNIVSYPTAIIEVEPA